MADIATSKDVTLPSGQKVTVNDTSGLKNWRTLIVNGLLVVVPALIAYLSGINWADYLSPQHAAWIVAGINIAMRVITNGPVGSSVSVVEK